MLLGLTEPDYGSNPGDMITRAEDMGDYYLLNGAKMWITNGSIAKVAVVWAKLDGVIRGFIVEDGDEGFYAPEMKGKHSLKASVTSELVFQDCKIPKDRILPGLKDSEGRSLASITPDTVYPGAPLGRLKLVSTRPRSTHLAGYNSIIQ